MVIRSKETALGIRLLSIKVKSGESTIAMDIAIRSGTSRSEEAFSRAKTTNSLKTSINANKSIKVVGNQRGKHEKNILTINIK